jgi:hypothetical protein
MASMVPVKTAKAHVEELRASFDAVCEALLGAFGTDGGASAAQKGELAKQCKGFNVLCDELHRLLTQRMERLLHGDETVQVHPDHLTDAEVQQHVDTTAALQKEVAELGARLLARSR